MPPPSPLVTNLAQAVEWLTREAQRIIRASAVPMRNGTMAFPPQVGIGYAAFWLRDYEYALEGSIQSLSNKELTQGTLNELVLRGQVRHTPGFMDWNGSKTTSNNGNYQSGGFWATPVGWFAYALDQADSALADKTVLEMVRHFQEHGACEWINREGNCQNPGYIASAALPLAGLRAMLERRAHAAASAK